MVSHAYNIIQNQTYLMWNITHILFTRLLTFFLISRLDSLGTCRACYFASMAVDNRQKLNNLIQYLYIITTK